MSHPAGYGTWRHMMARCYDQREAGFKNYGGRGISVCDRWKSLSSFLEDMGPPPSPTHSIDRLNGDGNYEPANCRWATVTEQRRRTRRLRLNEEAAKVIRHVEVERRLLARLYRVHPGTIDKVRSGRLWA